MTTAPKLIREQLLADLERVLSLKVQADDDEDSESVGATAIDAAYSALEFVVDHRDDIRSLAAEPVGGEWVGSLPSLPIAFFDEFGKGADDRVQDYATAAIRAAFLDAIEAAPKGSPTLILPPLPKPSRPDGGYAGEQMHEYAILTHERAAKPDSAEGEQPKADGVNQAGGFWIEVVDSPYGHGINFSNDFADLPRGTYRLSAAPQPEQKESEAARIVRLLGDPRRSVEVRSYVSSGLTPQPEQPARDGDAFRMTKRQAEILAAAHLLVRKLDQVHADPTYMAVWQIAHLHAGPYVGPKYEEELSRLRKAIGPPESHTQPPQQADGRAVAEVISTPEATHPHAAGPTDIQWLVDWERLPVGTKLYAAPPKSPGVGEAIPSGWVVVPQIGTMVKADHPITVLNPSDTFEVVAVEVDSLGARARGENTCWFGVSLLAALGGEK